MMMAFYAFTSMSQKINGGALNASIGFCGPLIAALVKNDASKLKYIAAYTLGPLLSGVIAGAFIKYFIIIHTPDPKESEDSPDLGSSSMKKLIESPESERE